MRKDDKNDKLVRVTLVYSDDTKMVKFFGEKKVNKKELEKLNIDEAKDIIIEMVKT